MRLITRQILANTAAQRWRNQFRSASHFQDKLQKLESLKPVGDNLDPDAIDCVIGNKAWTEVLCDECGCTPLYAVEIGEAMDPTNTIPDICLDCLKKAVALIEEQEAKNGNV
jgi:predicted nucleic-acid-binding Zn-ribbon protein